MEQHNTCKSYEQIKSLLSRSSRYLLLLSLQSASVWWFSLLLFCRGAKRSPYPLPSSSGIAGKSPNIPVAEVFWKGGWPACRHGFVKGKSSLRKLHSGSLGEEGLQPQTPMLCKILQKIAMKTYNPSPLHCPWTPIYQMSGELHALRAHMSICCSHDLAKGHNLSATQGGIPNPWFLARSSPRQPQHIRGH